MPWLGLAIGAGAGLLKNELVDQPKEERERKLAAATQRYSPWTGLKAGEIQHADPFGNMLSFGTAGGMLGQNLQNGSNWMNSAGSGPNYAAQAANMDIAPLATKMPVYDPANPNTFSGGPSKYIF